MSNIKKSGKKIHLQFLKSLNWNDFLTSQPMYKTPFKLKKYLNKAAVLTQPKCHTRHVFYVTHVTQINANNTDYISIKLIFYIFPTSLTCLEANFSLFLFVLTVFEIKLNLIQRLLKFLFLSRHTRHATLTPLQQKTTKRKLSKLF